MGTQKAIAKEIIDAGADYVLALKGNQETLHDAVIAYIDEQMQTDFANCGARRYITKEKGYGREEVRHDLQLPAPKTLPGFGLWQGLTTIGDAVLPSRRKGDGRYSLLYQQPAAGSKTFRAGRPQPMEYRTHTPQEPRYELSR